MSRFRLTIELCQDVKPGFTHFTTGSETSHTELTAVIVVTQARLISGSQIISALHF